MRFVIRPTLLPIIARTNFPSQKVSEKRKRGAGSLGVDASAAAVPSSSLHNTGATSPQSYMSAPESVEVSQSQPRR